VYVSSGSASRRRVTAVFWQMQQETGMMSVEIEAQTGVPADTFEAVARDVAHHIKSLIGISADVFVKASGAIPRSQGNAVRVRDLRPKGE
jgi:phenylacetate-CoA ligase